MTELSKTERFLRLTEVKTRTGLSRSSIYFYMNKGDFPQSINISANCVAWIESEIDEWMQNLISQRKSNLVSQIVANPS